MIYLVFLLAYLLGSINFALVIGKLFYKVDIREHGSGNLGATNSLVVLGKWAGIGVLIGDLGKGVIATLLPIILSVDVDPLFVGFAAVIGHCFPIFAGFKGGKAIATTAGVLLVFDPLMFIIVYVSSIIVMLISKYVFFGSLTTGIASTIYTIIVYNDIYYIVFFVSFTFLLTYLHRSNIRNFKEGKEPKINDKSLKDKRIKRNS